MIRPNWAVVLLALALAACAAPPATTPTALPEPSAAAPATVVLPTATDTPPSATPAPPSATPAPTERAPTTQATSAPRTPSPAASATPSVDPASPTAALFVDPTPTPGGAAPTAVPATVAPAAAAERSGSGAPAASQSDTRPAAATGKPVRLVIDGINLDRTLVPVGLDANRLPIVPDHDIGWYTLGAQPGQGENVVLWGHVLRFRRTPNIPAPFARLKELKKGDVVALYDARGTTYRYVVTEQVWATPDQVEYMLPRGREQVTMISCIGDKVVADGSVEMSHRLITIAEPER